MDDCMTAPLLIAVVALIVIAYVVLQVLTDFTVYSKDTGFPTPTIFFIGTLVAFGALGMYVAVARAQLIKCDKSISFILASSLFYLFYFLFVLNLTLRAEYYVNAARLPTTAGSFWLFLALLVVLIQFLYSPNVGRAFLLFPIVWCMYLVWNWVYKI
jgi:uncharacterized membrane protein